MVSTENLSPSMGLVPVVACWLIAVDGSSSVSSGADAITSAFPAIKHFNLEFQLCWFDFDVYEFAWFA